MIERTITISIKTLREWEQESFKIIPFESMRYTYDRSQLKWNECLFSQ